MMKVYPGHKKISCFRRWTRKKNSILISLSKVIKIGVLCLAYSLVNRMPSCTAQSVTGDSLKPWSLEEVEITGRRSEIVSTEISRMVTIVRRDEVEKAGFKSIADLLEFVANVDIRQRGPMGIQADASIRGSSFDHVMVLINGIPLSDPQTGHFSLDMPIDAESVERIEILEGPAARVLGPGAFMGAINIVTRKNQEDELYVSQGFGKYNLYRTHLHAGFQTGSVSNFLSAGRSSSSGYMKNTDHTLYNVYYRGRLEKDITSFDFQAGFQDKRFGAGGFYSPKFPGQYEETGTWFSSLKISTGDKVKVSPFIYWRRKNDHFLLDRDNPDFYENFHVTDIIGSQVNITYSGRYFTSGYGFDLRSENILSNNIGIDNPVPKAVPGEDSIYYSKQYQRTNFAFFSEYIFRLRKLTLTTGFMANMNSGFQNKVSFFPGADLSYTVNDYLSFFSSFNRALHLPTFTDLFYKDPVNQGKLDLEPNRMISYEVGLRFTGSKNTLRISTFYNSGKDIVDWLWSYENNTFSPVNLKHYQSLGLSTNISVTVDEPILRWPGKLGLNYSFLSIDKSGSDKVSKYYNLRHKLSVTLAKQISGSLNMNWSISYQDRFGEAMNYRSETLDFIEVPYKPYWLVDGLVTWNYRYLQLFAEVTNLLNSRYIDAGSAIQPGRWIKVGIILKLPL